MSSKQTTANELYYFFFATLKMTSMAVTASEIYTCVMMEQNATILMFTNIKL